MTARRSPDFQKELRPTLNWLLTTESSRLPLLVLPHAPRHIRWRLLDQYVEHYCRRNSETVPGIVSTIRTERAGHGAAVREDGSPGEEVDLPGEDVLRVVIPQVNLRLPTYGYTLLGVLIDLEQIRL